MLLHNFLKEIRGLGLLNHTHATRQAYYTEDKEKDNSIVTKKHQRTKCTSAWPTLTTRDPSPPHVYATVH